MSDSSETIVRKHRWPRAGTVTTLVSIGASSGLVCAAIMLISAKERLPAIVISKERQAELTRQSKLLAYSPIKRPKKDDTDLLDRRIPLFRAKNTPVTKVVHALNLLAVDVCYEASRDTTVLDRYVDQDGTETFGADKVISMELVDTTVRQILDCIVVLDPRYRWHRVPGTDLINLVPEKARFDFEIGPVEISGNPTSILMEIASHTGYESLRHTGFVRGGHLPIVSVHLGQCRARDFLNEMARQLPGLTWHAFPSGVSFWYVPLPAAEQVDLIYPEVRRGKSFKLVLEDIRRGKPVNFAFRYDIVWDKLVNGTRTVVVERHRVDNQ